jgi:hypothetical protein
MAAGKVVFDAAPARLDGTVLDGLYGGVVRAVTAEAGQ